MRAINEDVQKILIAADGKRVQALTGMLRNRKILPERGTIHIVGASTSAEEWALPILTRPDVKIVISEVGSALIILQRQLRSDDVLMSVWRNLNQHYANAVSGSEVKSFADFKRELRARISLNDGVENTKYVKSDHTLPPSTGEHDVPKADLMILNQPHLETSIIPSDGPTVATALTRQLRPQTGIMWVNTENLEHRIGSSFRDAPQIQMPERMTSFDLEGGLQMGDPDLAAGLPSSFLVIESVLIFPH